MNLKTTLGGFALVMALAVVFSIGSGVVSAFVPTYEDIEFTNCMSENVQSHLNKAIEYGEKYYPIGDIFAIVCILVVGYSGIIRRK